MTNIIYQIETKREKKFKEKEMSTTAIIMDDDDDDGKWTKFEIVRV